MFPSKNFESTKKSGLRRIGRRIICSLATCIIGLGVAAFLLGFACSMLGPSSPRFGSSICLPLSLPEDVGTDESERIYVGLQFYSRIQVYDSNGEFIYGFFAKTDGGRFRMRVERDGSLTIASARTHSIHVYDNTGQLLSSKQNAKETYDQFVSQQPLVNVDSRGRHYLIRGSVMNPEIVREDRNGHISLRIKTPLWFRPFLGPIPCFITTIVVALLQRLSRWLLIRVGRH